MKRNRAQYSTALYYRPVTSAVTRHKPQGVSEWVPIGQGEEYSGAALTHCGLRNVEDDHYSHYYAGLFYADRMGYGI